MDKPVIRNLNDSQIVDIIETLEIELGLARATRPIWQIEADLEAYKWLRNVR